MDSLALHLITVTFQDVGFVSATLLRLVWGQLHLTNVHFIGVISQVVRTDYINGITVFNSSAEVVYQEGFVELLNKDAYFSFSKEFFPQCAP